MRKFDSTTAAWWYSACHPQAVDACGHWMQVASRPGITVGQLQEEFTRWDEQYDSSVAAAGPAKRRLRNEFMRGTYRQLLSNVERKAAARQLPTASVPEPQVRFLFGQELLAAGVGW